MTDWASEKAREITDHQFTSGNVTRWHEIVAAALREAERRVHEEYRAVYGCRACGEQHPEYVICPPHEVRTTGRASVNQLVARARVDAERRMQERAVEVAHSYHQRGRSDIASLISQKISALIPGEG